MRDYIRCECGAVVERKSPTHRYCDGCREGAYKRVLAACNAKRQRGTPGYKERRAKRVALCLKLRAEGATQQEIARRAGCSYQNVAYLLKRYGDPK